MNSLELGISDEQRRKLLCDDLPEVCRRCELTEERLRIPGQFLCETCALDAWGEKKLLEVLRETREVNAV